MHGYDSECRPSSVVIPKISSGVAYVPYEFGLPATITFYSDGAATMACASTCCYANANQETIRVLPHYSQASNMNATTLNREIEMQMDTSVFIISTAAVTHPIFHVCNAKSINAIHASSRCSTLPRGLRFDHAAYSAFLRRL